MTKSIFEKITLTPENEKELIIATSDEHRKKVVKSEAIRMRRRNSIRSKQPSLNIKQAFAQYS